MIESIATTITTLSYRFRHFHIIIGRCSEPDDIMGKETVDLESQHQNLPEHIPYAKLMLDQGVLTRDVVEWEYEGSGTAEDPYIVDWIDKDQRNPMTWSTGRKWLGCLSMALATLTVSFCSSAYSGGKFLFQKLFVYSWGTVLI